MIVAQLRYVQRLPSHIGNSDALDSIQTELVEQGKIRTHNRKYGVLKNESDQRDTPYCRWLDTTPTYRILKAFRGLKVEEDTQ